MGNPTTLQIRGGRVGRKTLLVAVYFFGAFFQREKYDFILHEGFFMKNMAQIRLTLRG
jgi:hypothetical protein